MKATLLAMYGLAAGALVWLVLLGEAYISFSLGEVKLEGLEHESGSPQHVLRLAQCCVGKFGSKSCPNVKSVSHIHQTRVFRAVSDLCIPALQ